MGTVEEPVAIRVTINIRIIRTTEEVTRIDRNHTTRQEEVTTIDPVTAIVPDLTIDQKWEL